VKSVETRGGHQVGGVGHQDLSLLLRGAALGPDHSNRNPRHSSLAASETRAQKYVLGEEDSRP
jgi:hypothetical protein